MDCFDEGEPSCCTSSFFVYMYTRLFNYVCINIHFTHILILARCAAGEITRRHFRSYTSILLCLHTHSFKKIYVSCMHIYSCTYAHLPIDARREEGGSEARDRFHRACWRLYPRRLRLVVFVT